MYYASTMLNLVKLYTTITKLQHFKHLKIGIKLHANSQSRSHIVCTCVKDLFICMYVYCIIGEY